MTPRLSWFTPSPPGWAILTPAGSRTAPGSSALPAYASTESRPGRRCASALSLADAQPEHSERSAGLTCDQLVTYLFLVIDDDRVFKALADQTRRFLLDLLFARDGRTLTELESGLEMTRFGVMKHLRVLEEAGLVITRRSGREKLHFLNPVPIRLIHDRWIDKYTERQVSALVDLKAELEEQA
jgi:DNA-binding transcriptional ArsR family regulator